MNSSRAREVFSLIIAVDFQCASHIPAAQVRELAEGGYLVVTNQPFFWVKRAPAKRIWNWVGDGCLSATETGAVHDGSGCASAGCATS